MPLISGDTSLYIVLDVGFMSSLECVLHFVLVDSYCWMPTSMATVDFDDWFTSAVDLGWFGMLSCSVSSGLLEVTDNWKQVDSGRKASHRLHQHLRQGLRNLGVSGLVWFYQVNMQSTHRHDVAPPHSSHGCSRWGHRSWI